MMKWGEMEWNEEAGSKSSVEHNLCLNSDQPMKNSELKERASGQSQPCEIWLHRSQTNTDQVSSPSTLLPPIQCQTVTPIEDLPCPKPWAKLAKNTKVNKLQFASHSKR
ncbi:cysteinyl leukotriene receptor 1 isoform 2-T2 [Trichechus inunguis]